ncbi:tRNA (adenosine(37)-N6)-dimethylallyltransferase MiaA [bacterium]|nr:MAG: tRNA (adenosine(37)-N6)-dimethylallyltransferase MiaA [bacterium]
MKNDKKFIFIITGPTASGKTACADQLAHLLDCEVINVDVGQFYTPLSVGTAKPDWKNFTYPCHLFDIISEPKDLTVVHYRTLVIDKIKEIQDRGRIPILVGGSLFYIKSIFFPPHEFNTIDQFDETRTSDIKPDDLWDSLYVIDPDRAAKIHKNDTYRLQRALHIWQKTGQKPSSFLPKVHVPFNTILISLVPEKEFLRDQIKKRTIEMITHDGWIKEAKKLIGTEWETFLEAKGLIGYSEIFAWLKNGAIVSDLDALINTIQLETIHYAKRQLTFLKGFIQLINKYQEQYKQEEYVIITETIKQVTRQEIERIAALTKRLGKNVDLR